MTAARPSPVGLRPRTGSSWLLRAAWVGLATSVFVPAGVALTSAIPALQYDYPLALLPLLLTGPLAVREVRGSKSLAAALVAGLVATLVAGVSLALGSQALDDYVWSLINPLSYPPVPPLPHLALLPESLMTWAQQDLLVTQPIAAVLLGAGSLALEQASGPAIALGTRALPRSANGRLTVVLGAFTGLTFLVGLVGFGLLEDMHFRGHHLQLLSTWQRDLRQARNGVEEERRAAMSGGDPSAPAAQVQSALADVTDPSVYPDVAVTDDEVDETRRAYTDLLAGAVSATTDFGANPSNRDAYDAARTALDAATARLESDVAVDLDTDDVAHHERLFVVMLVVALSAGLGLWTGKRTVATIIGPLRELGAHALRVARGDFSARVKERDPVEVRELAGAVNEMTSDLDRLYAEEREARAEAEALAARERELADAKEFWTNTVVHDLKSPLSVVSGFADLLAEGMLGDLSERQRSATNEIRRASITLQGLIADVNDTFRLQSPDVAVELSPTPPAALLHTASEQGRTDRAAPSIDVDPDLPPVLADARLIERVLHNLISNAYKHAGPDAHVVLSARGTQDGSIDVCVSDDGPGIKLEARERIFERFARGEGGQSGSGLGLAFCKLVVERHGGRIWAAGTYGEGAEIHFTLPVAARARLQRLAQ